VRLRHTTTNTPPSKSNMSPVPVIVCGRSPEIAQKVKADLQPEYEGTDAANPGLYSVIPLILR
jgi:hypothetical protein